MIANELHEKVVILKKVITKNDFGEPVDTWEEYKTLKARIGYKTSTEKEINNQLTALRVIKIKIRFNRNVDETMRIRFWDDDYDIRYIEHHRRTDTFITAERGKQ